MKEQLSTVSARATEEGAATAKHLSGEDYFAGFDASALELTMETLFKSGVHFGHNTARRNPKADQFIFGVRGGINIIDLGKTVEKLTEAMEFLRKVVLEGHQVLFVGTKKQAKHLVASAAVYAGMPWVSERWLGGTFTNFSTISSRTKYLREQKEKKKQGEFSKYTKFEQMKFAEEIERLEHKMGGIENMTKLPAAVIVMSAIDDSLAIKEAQVVGIPIIALVDTNVDPKNIDYPVPANDDAVSSLKIILSFFLKAVLEGKEKIKANKGTNEKANKETDIKNN